MSASEPTSLAVESLIIGRGDFRAGPVSFAVAAGGFVIVIGPNGGGKTTLLKTIAGLLPALGGTVAFDSGGRRSATAYLPPPGALSANFATEHVVALGRAAGRRWSAVLSQADLEAARAALATVGLADLARRPFDRLSSGQQQLALIARLTVQEAKLCLLDEPTALLDPLHADQVERTIRRLADQGRIVIASSHHLALAASADLVVSVGEAVEAGAPSDGLAPGALSALYGISMSVCPCCRQPISTLA